ncbi:type II toxin-antitoxin system VapC family toxin [Rhizobium sp. R711]|uniref:type II toxin-antitoxin system VapC family toxin n=1 Tax=unclassified Rhizobium TaxID=2613769 RepID=UPI0032AFCEDD
MRSRRCSARRTVSRMRLLLDTHILIWVAGDSGRLPDRLRALISDKQNELLFSPASLWEIVIKQAQSRPDFRADPTMLKERLLQNGYVELPINGEHTLAFAELPPIHKGSLRPYPDCPVKDRRHSFGYGCSSSAAVSGPHGILRPGATDQFPRIAGRRRPCSLAQSRAIS